MSSSTILGIFLPLALAIITFSMGLSLVVDDFRRVVQYPKAMIWGLLIQLFVLPAIGLGVAMAFQLPPALGIGLFLLACCPSGATSNFITHLAKGETALAITFTAINSLITVVTIPFFVNFGSSILGGTALEVHLDPFRFIKEVSVIILIPLSLGMALRAWREEFSLRIEKGMKLVAIILFALVVIGAVAKEYQNVSKYFGQVGMAALTLNVLAMAVGYYSSRLVQLTRKQRIAIAIEIGVHNATLAIYIANNILQNQLMSIPPSVYGLLMFVTSGIFAYFVTRQKEVVA
jgi:bile acid:Na+ symporter, BASS family